MSASKQSERCLVVSIRLRIAIKRYHRDRKDPHMKRKALRLSESSNEIKGKNLMLTELTSKELFEDPLKSIDQSKRWKIKSSYRDIDLTYRDDETIAYVAFRMPVVYSACFRVLREDHSLKHSSNCDKTIECSGSLKMERESWSLDEIKFRTLKKQHAKRNPEDLEIDYGGWGRIIFPLVRRGRQLEVDVCQSTKQDGSSGSFEHMVLTHTAVAHLRIINCRRRRHLEKTEKSEKKKSDADSAFEGDDEDQKLISSRLPNRGATSVYPSSVEIAPQVEEGVSILHDIPFEPTEVVEVQPTLQEAGNVHDATKEETEQIGTEAASRDAGVGVQSDLAQVGAPVEVAHVMVDERVVDEFTKG
ncbi:hypothetical protein Ddye_008400 [Dipteronia dyeriana]|uniref:Uncharacterized protein n=1 Tax=Dipteronia dyeriana TaxID=168575 RepID=A0AAE0CLV6_9ROSI|nr:hypothetical protein Ddye_008400 [Dipteronia dyeriana]